MLKNHTRLFSGEDNMSIVVREYDAKTDSKNRIRLQNPVFEYFHNNQARKPVTSVIGRNRLLLSLFDAKISLDMYSISNACML